VDVPTSRSRAEVEQLIAQDPFAVEGLIDDLTILDWDPMFGAFADDPNRAPPEPARR
jgi:hypothetical protein